MDDSKKNVLSERRQMQIIPIVQCHLSKVQEQAELIKDDGDWNNDCFLGGLNEKGRQGLLDCNVLYLNQVELHWCMHLEKCIMAVLL